MSVHHLTVCHWIERRRVDRNLHEPPWPAVERVIRSMDGGEVNDVYLYPAEGETESFLCVGGGPEKFVVVVTHPAGGSWSLVEPQRPAEPVVALTVGGQDGGFPSNWVVDVEAALQAAEHYFHDGARAPNLAWERQ